MILTPREERVIQLLADGVCRLDVASRLGINETDVDYHMKKIRKKLGAASNVRAAVIWIQQQRSSESLDHPSPDSLLRDFNTCHTCRGLGFVRKPVVHAVIGGQRA